MYVLVIVVGHLYWGFNYKNRLQGLNVEVEGPPVEVYRHGDGGGPVVQGLVSLVEKEDSTCRPEVGKVRENGKYKIVVVVDDFSMVRSKSAGRDGKLPRESEEILQKKVTLC